MLHIWELNIVTTGIEIPDSEIVVLFASPQADGGSIYYAYWDNKWWQVMWRFREIQLTAGYKWVHKIYVDIIEAANGFDWSTDIVIRLAPTHILKNRFYV